MKQKDKMLCSRCSRMRDRNYKSIYCRSCYEMVRVSKSDKAKELRKKAQDKHRKEHREERNKQSKEYFRNNKEKWRAYTKKYESNLNNFIKIKCRKATRLAIKQGLLIHPSKLLCSNYYSCDNQATEYHHKDYTKPLEVIAYCEKCHAKTWRKEE